MLYLMYWYGCVMNEVFMVGSVWVGRWWLLRNGWVWICLCSEVVSAPFSEAVLCLGFLLSFSFATS